MHTANATPSITRCYDYPDGRIVYAVPCLGGHDVNRHRSELLVEIMPSHGWLAEANTGDRLVNLGDTELLGWGDLDGPAVVVTIAGAGWQVAVPRSAYDSLAQVQAKFATLPTAVRQPRWQARYAGSVLGWYDTAEEAEAAVDAAREAADSIFRH